MMMMMMMMMITIRFGRPPPNRPAWKGLFHVSFLYPNANVTRRRRRPWTVLHHWRLRRAPVAPVPAIVPGAVNLDSGE
uniref:Putative secreted protein n=1 Tax=Anopheles triannulatus TaxID=58253 RepID=A0A2M4B2T0_9DIPT